MYFFRISLAIIAWLPRYLYANWSFFLLLIVLIPSFILGKIWDVHEKQGFILISLRKLFLSVSFQKRICSASEQHMHQV